LLAAALFGIGFNVKMLVAFGVLPAFALVYLLGAPSTIGRRVGRLLLAGLVLAPVALSWSLVYDVTPPESRPYVDSTDDNSMLELVVGHNFVQRFVRRGDFRERAAAAASATPDNANITFQGRDFAPAGPFRLAAPTLAAQVGWLFPLALIGGIAAWRRYRRSPHAEDWQLAMWGGWTVVYGVVFSAAGGIFHSYYTAVMAPALCALAGIGGVALWQVYHAGGKAALWLPAAILATALWQAHIGRRLSQPADERRGLAAGGVDRACHAHRSRAVLAARPDPRFRARRPRRAARDAGDMVGWHRSDECERRFSFRATAFPVGRGDGAAPPLCDDRRRAHG